MAEMGLTSIFERDLSSKFQDLSIDLAFVSNLGHQRGSSRLIDARLGWCWRYN